MGYMHIEFLFQFQKDLVSVFSQVYDLGNDGVSLTKVAQMAMGDVVRSTLSTLRTADKSLVQSLVRLSVLPRSESSTLHLLATTSAGVGLIVISCHVACRSSTSVVFSTG